MSAPPSPDEPESPPGTEPKLRQCLRCQETFRSEWAGERICSRCKQSAAWRMGEPSSSRPVGGRR